MNKSFITNLISLLLLMAGLLLPNNWLLMVGLFALSGALTNWLAIYMLFEKVQAWWVPGSFQHVLKPSRQPFGT